MAATLILCVDIGGTRTKYGLVDPARGRIVARLTRPTVRGGLDEMAAALGDAAEALYRRAGVGRDVVRGAGIGIPGYVAGDRISLVWPFLAFMEGDRFRPLAEGRLGLPVRLDNDARIIALAEAHFGAGVGAGRLLSLAIGTGVGFGFVVEGRLQERTSINHMAGHLLLHPGARPCYCGLSGCFESLVSGPGLVETYRALAGGATDDLPDAQALFCAAVAGEPLATQAVNAFLDDLALGLNVYLNLYAPDVIVLGGGLAPGLKPYLPRLQTALVAGPYAGYTVRLRTTRLGARAGVLGAAGLWVEESSRSDP